MLETELLKQDISKRAETIYEEIYSRTELLDGKKYERGKLNFLIVNDKSINGKAWRENEIDNIEINDGVFEKYSKYFKETNDYFVAQLIGKILPDREPEEIEIMSMEGVHFDGGQVTAFDSKRIVNQRTSLMEIFVSRFILTHELGHLFNGHCDYLSVVENGNAVVQMYYGENDKVEQPKARRTLEMDADAFATTNSFQHLIYLYSDFEHQVNCPFLQPIQLFYWWSFAIRSHFLVCEDYLADTLNYSDTMCHLPSNARWFMVYMIAMELCDMYLDSVNINVDEVKDSIINGAKEAENVFNEIKGSNYHGAENILGNNKFKYYYAEVNGYWKEIVDELSKYSRTRLYNN